MNAKVEDPMGLETGIRIDMVRTVLDKTKGNIIIHGRMTACTRSVVSPDVEPDVECAIIDRENCIAVVSLSHHNGCFWINRQAMFTIRVEDVSAVTTGVSGLTGRRCSRSAWRMFRASFPGTTSASFSCGSYITGTEGRIRDIDPSHGFKTKI